MSQGSRQRIENESYLIRAAQAGDAAAIKTLVHRERLNPIGLDWERFLVAVDETGNVLACGQIKPHRDGSQELASLVIAPEWRGQGLARRIIEALLSSCSTDLYLTCRASLEKFYERFGFTVISPPEMPGYFRTVSRIFRILQLITRYEGLLVMRRQVSQTISTD